MNNKITNNHELITIQCYSRHKVSEFLYKVLDEFWWMIDQCAQDRVFKFFTNVCSSKLEKDLDSDC